MSNRKPHTPEVKAKISNSLKAMYEKSPRHLQIETIERIRESNKITSAKKKAYYDDLVYRDKNGLL
jgi:hypothetical protein